MMIDAKNAPLNCGNFLGNNVPKYIFKKPNIGNEKFILEVFPIERITNLGQTTPTSFQDSDLIAYSGDSTIIDYFCNVNQLTTTFYDTEIISLNSGIILGNINSTSIASGVSSGTTSLVAKHSSEIFSVKQVSIINKQGIAGFLFDKYKENTLSKHVSDAIDNRIQDKNSQTSKNIFSTRNDSTSSYIRNTECWVYDITDVTCLSPWNSTGGSQRGGVLISPRHIIFAAHFQINTGATIRFVDMNNNVITRTLVNKITHPNYYNPVAFFPDITIGLLNEDVPSSISIAKILPTSWDSYMPSLTIDNDNIFVGNCVDSYCGFTVPCLCSDQEKKALISELKCLILPESFLLPDPGSIPWPEDGRFTTTLWKSPININKRFDFFESIITGDSGSPAFLIINNQLVLVTLWTFGGAGRGTSLLYFKDDINQIMSDLGGNYSLTEVSLDSFNNYSQL
jgi:hypothetical protein